MGTAFAFLFKTSLVSAVGVAFCQGFWFAARRKAIRIKGLDAIMAVVQNPLNFFSPDLLLETKVLFALALISWLLPIASILSPGALTGA